MPVGAESELSSSIFSMTNPEKNMHNQLKNVQKRITFNFENFANATEDILQMDINTAVE